MSPEGADFPPIVVQAFGRNGCTPSHGYAVLEHPEAIDGEPVGRARVGFQRRVAPLTGAAVLHPARRRGVYAAMLAARLDLAAAVGCHTAVVKARRTESMPALLREGFVPIAHERARLLDIAS